MNAYPRYTATAGTWQWSPKHKAYLKQMLVANLNKFNSSGCAAVRINFYVSRETTTVLMIHFTGRK